MTASPALSSAELLVVKPKSGGRMTLRSPALYLGVITTGSGRPLSNSDVQAELAKALLSISVSHPAPSARDERPSQKAG